jgi:hypothetical protein
MVFRSVTKDNVVGASLSKPRLAREP